MDASARAEAVQLLGSFNDEMTRVIDGIFGTQWAEIEEMIALVTLCAQPTITTRELAAVSGLNRRAVSRLIARLQHASIVTTRAFEGDKRAIAVVLTPHGRVLSDRLRTDSAAFLEKCRDTARAISAGLGGVPTAPSSEAPADTLDLLRRICESGAALVSYMPSAVAEGRLAARQRAALVMIAMQGGVRPANLIGPLEVSPSGVAYIVDQLCAKGYVERRRGTPVDDKRAVSLHVTQAGLGVVTAVEGGIEAERGHLSALFDEIAQWSAAREAAPSITNPRH